MDTFFTTLKQFGHTRTNVPLFKHATFRIGGPARFLLEVEETAKLIGLLNFLSGEGIDYFILGGGTNILFSDEGFDGVVIKIKNQKLVCHSREGGNPAMNIIEADAGVWLGEVLNLAVSRGLTGLEWAAGIPGTVGGAVRGNAGAFGRDTSSAVARVEVWRDGEALRLSKEECGFTYRHSAFCGSRDVILRVWFALAPGDRAKITALVFDYLKQRQGQFPPFSSAGCFFKNIKLEQWPGDKNGLPELYRQRGMVPVGWLTEQAGVKGLTIGGAQVSEQHGNFIVNRASATQSDVLAVVEKVKEAVYNKFGVELEVEVEIVR